MEKLIEDPFKQYGLDVESFLKTEEGKKELLFGSTPGLQFSTKTVDLGNLKMSSLPFKEHIPGFYEAFEEEGGLCKDRKLDSYLNIDMSSPVQWHSAQLADLVMIPHNEADGPRLIISFKNSEEDARGEEDEEDCWESSMTALPTELDTSPPSSINSEATEATGAAEAIRAIGAFRENKTTETETYDVGTGAGATNRENRGTLQVSLSLSLSLSLSPILRLMFKGLFLYTVDVLCNAQWCIRQL